MEKNATRTGRWESGGGGWVECWAILQSDISFAINPIWIDFPPSHTLRNSPQMLFFFAAAAAAASLSHDTASSRKRHREERQSGRSWSSASL